ncbi:MAG: class I SAM-dependent methyltransferase [Candidatus Methanoperedens sp.]|nr:class I SAM-dependent methyltransferase [Candidatus Methanoperedens sp.]
MDKNKRVCPVEMAGSLDNIFRKWLHNPDKLLKDYVKDGMTVLDVGCGPGLFSIEMAAMVGKSGRVIAADLQEGMLERLKNKIRGKEIESRIKIHKCTNNRIGVIEKIDFVLAFYMVHEVSDQTGFFREIKSILKPDGKVFVIEPKFHVSKNDFEETLKVAQEAGLKPYKGEKVFFSRAIVLVNENNERNISF